MIGYVYEIEAVAGEREVVCLDQRSNFEVAVEHYVAADCDALTRRDPSIACSSSRKLRSHASLVFGIVGSTERAVASQRRQVGASGSRFIQSKWING